MKMIAVETCSIAFLCMLFHFQPTTAGLRTTTGPPSTARPFFPTSIPVALYGDHVCKRQVLRPSYDASDFTYSCWKTREVHCKDCHGSGCQKVPLYTTYPSQGSWWQTTTKTWSEPTVTSRLMTTLIPGWTVRGKRDVGGVTTEYPTSSAASGDVPDWWLSPAAMPYATEQPFASSTVTPDRVAVTNTPPWVSNNWWTATPTQSWSSYPWHHYTSSSWASSGWSWLPTTTIPSGWFSNPWWASTTAPNTPVKCYMRELEECHDTKHTISYIWMDEQFCCAGYQQFGQICIETDHCKVNNGGCEQVCEDGLYGPKCSCWSGYVSDGGSRCTDIDECFRYNGICDHKCTNIPGAHYCECNPGHEHTSLGKCEAINKCQYGNGGCEHYCVNTGSDEHHCKCSPGFTLVDGIKCKDARLVSDDDDDEDGGLSTLELICIIIGCILIGLFIGYFIFLAVRLHRKTQTPLLAPSVSSTPPGTPEFTKANMKGFEAGLKTEYEDVATDKANDGNFYVNEEDVQKK